MAGSPQERVLAAELMVVVGVQTADALSGAYTGKFSLPAPNRYFAAIVVYLMLAGMAMFGPRPARLAVSFGGLSALVIMLAPSAASVKAGKPQSVLVSALSYLNQMITGGSIGATHSSPSTTPPSTVGPITVSPGALAPGQTGTAGVTPGVTDLPTGTYNPTIGGKPINPTLGSPGNPLGDV